MIEDRREIFHQYMQAQKKAIDVYKWIESEKAGHDIGQKAVFDWIERFSEEFYKNYFKENI